MELDARYRLPRNARPERYELELRPDLGAARFDGTVTVTVEVTEPSSRLVLHAADLDISAARLERPGGAGGPDVRPVWATDEEAQTLTLAFDDPVEPGTYRLSLTFAGTLNDQLRGFYRSTFRADDGTERVIATTQFEASDARRAFPCWDEPDFKAVFSVTLVIERGLTGLSNGALESTRVLDDGRVELRFSDTMPMSTYLVAFVVGPYELTDPLVVDGIPIRIAAVPGKLGLTAFALDAARHSLHFLADYFGIPYPAEKLDHIAVPDFAFGAMENLGCVTYRESFLLADPDTSASVTRTMTGTCQRVSASPLAVGVGVGAPAR